ncbi:hypothetical protein EAE99_010303 [Botrytis elliptica]|nr:hypothetical protein EAE99_010303 [Botrytis elliptica]
MASNVNNGSGQVERRVTRSGRAPTVRTQSENQRNRNSQVAAVAVAVADENEDEDETPAPRGRGSRNLPRSQRDTRDAFTRMIAPKLQIDRCKVELEYAGQECLNEIRDLKSEEGLDVGLEIKRREQLLENGHKILEVSRKAIAWIDSRIKAHNSNTEKCAEKIKKYQQLLSTLSVDVQIMLERLLVERQGQVIELTRKNEELLKQVGVLTGKITDLTQNSSTTSIECDELKEFLQDNLSALKNQNKENIETEAIANYRKQYEQLSCRNEEISKQKGRVDGELMQSREESTRFREEKDRLFRENEELKNDITQHKLDYHNLSKDKEQVDSSLVTKSARITELEALIKEGQQSLQQEILKSSISNVRVEQLEKEDTQRQEALRKAEVGSITMDYELNASKVQLKETNEELMNVKSIAEQVPGLKARIEDLTKALEDSSEDQKLKKTLWDMDVEELEKELKSVKADNRSLNADVLERDSKITLLESELSNLESIRVSNEALLKEYSDSIITKDLYIENMISRIKNSDDIDCLTLEYDQKIKKLSADLEKAQKDYHNSRKIRDEDRGGHRITQEKAHLAKQKMLAEHIKAMAEKDYQLVEYRKEFKDKVSSLENLISQQSRVISQQDNYKTQLKLEIQRLNNLVEVTQREVQITLQANLEYERQANEARSAVNEGSKDSAYFRGIISQLRHQVSGLHSELSQNKDSSKDVTLFKTKSADLEEIIRKLRRDASIETQRYTELSIEKEIRYNRLCDKKRQVEREVDSLQAEKLKISLKMEGLERDIKWAQERHNEYRAKNIKEGSELRGKISNLECQMESMKTSEEYKKCEDEVIQLEKSQLTSKIEMERLEERIKGMKTQDEYDSLVRENNTEKLELEKKVEMLQEEIQGMKTDEEYDTLARENNTEKLELEKKVEMLQEEVQGMKTKEEYETLVTEKNAEKLELEKKIEKLQEDLSKSTTSGSLTINTGVFGHGNGHNIQQSPQHFAMGPQSPSGDHMRIQQSPSPRTPGFQPPFQGFSTHGPPQHGPSGSLSQSPQQGFFGTSPQFPMHPPVYGQSLPGFDAGPSMHPPTGFGSGPPMYPPVGMGFGVGPSLPPGFNHPLGFQQPNPTLMQGQFGLFQLDRNFPPLKQASPPVPHSFRFLVSGGVKGGVLTLNVPAGLIQKMNEQIDEWIEAKKPPRWYQPTPVGRTRCVEVRSRGLGLVRGEPTSDDGDKFACIHCMDRGLLCTLIGRDGPVIVPLNLKERLPGATPQSPGYYIRY